MKKSTHPIMQLLVLVALMLVMLLASSVLTVVLRYTNVGIESASGMRWVQGLTQVLCFGFPVLLIALIYYRGQHRGFLRADFSGEKWLLGIVGVLIMMLLVPVNERLTEWNDSWQLGRLGETMRSMQEMTEGIVEQLLGTTTLGGLMANMLVVALIPAVTEELFFRCGVQNLLQRWLHGNAHVAVWLTAVLFSLGHGEIFSFMPRLLMGATLGYLYVYGDSMVPNMLAHFFNNAIVVLLYWMGARGVLDIDPEAPLQFGTWLTAACMLAAVALFVVTFVKRQKTND